MEENKEKVEETKQETAEDTQQKKDTPKAEKAKEAPQKEAEEVKAEETPKKEAKKKEEVKTEEVPKAEKTAKTPAEEEEKAEEAPVAEAKKEEKIKAEETPVKEVQKEEKIKAEEAAKEAAKAEKTAETPAKEEKTKGTSKEKAKEVTEESPQAKTAEKENGKIEVKEEEDNKPKIGEDFFEPIGDDFNWSDLDNKGFGENYSPDERTKMADVYADTLTSIEEKEVVLGKVVGINDRDVILNIGFKSDGLVSATEFRDLPELKIGDEVQVYIEEQENAKGQLVLSRRKAKIVKAWEQIQSALDNDSVIEGMVKRRTKGGLIVDIYGVEAFLPGSQIDVKPIRDFDVFVGKKMEVKVVKINYTNDNVVVSHKVLIEKDLEQQKAEILENLEKGQVLEGVIKNMTNFGVFIDLGGVDGLLHITDISWGRINHPEEVLKLDEKVNVVVLDFDDDKRRISLGMKQLTSHPWDSLDKEIEIGSKVEGKIVNVADYGAFLEIIPGVEGLIHVSEMSWSQHLRNPQDFINIGDSLEAVVLTIDREERKMSLGIKQLTEDPWTKQDVLTKYAVGTNHKGIVRNLTNFGLFIELEEGIDGLVHVSDLSWTKKIKHPSEFVKVSDELEVKVLELDVENRRLALGHKQLEENPWDTFETVFTKGSTHKCTVISKSDKGAFLELPYGLEGTVAGRNLKKEDGTVANVGETLDFIVLEFSKDDRRIVLSHTATFQEHKEPAPKKKSGGAGSTISKINKEAEKSTLGDLEALSQLKEQMEGGSAKAEKPKKPAARKEEEIKAEAPKKEETKTEKNEAKASAKTESKAKASDKKEEPKAEAPKEEAVAEEKTEEKKDSATEEKAE